MKVKKNLITYLSLAILVLLIVFFVYTNYKIAQKRGEAGSQTESLEAKVETLEERNRELLNRKNRVESDEYIESVAREQLELKKPEEEVVVISKETDQDQESSEEEGNFWERFIGIFK